MSEVKNIKVISIDPKSTINVRRTAVKDNVEKVKLSIREYGYWPDQPIIIRPHPKSESRYQYEYVTGQCRLKACLELGFEEIPAFVEELDDDQSIQRSWLENEVRGDLPLADRAYWVDRIFKKYSGSGFTPTEALEKAAKYLGVKPNTVMKYYSLVVLPKDIMDMVDKGSLNGKYAVEIVKNTYDASRLEKSQESMRQRAEWVIGLDRERRNHAIDALKQKGHKATIADLNTYVDEKTVESKLTVEYTIPDQSQLFFPSNDN